MNKIYILFSNFYVLAHVCVPFFGFDCFSFNFGAFLKFWRNAEI